MAAEKPESILTVRWWGVLLVVFGIFGWLAICAMNHESRLTRVEVQYLHMVQDLSDIKSMVSDIRQDQMRKARKERE